MSSPTAQQPTTQDRAASGRAPFRRGQRPPLEVCDTLDWEALTPRTRYARRVRPVLNWLLLLAVAPLALPLLGLLTLVNGIAFRSLGQAFFLQSRVGRRGQVFTLVKFRTMNGGRAKGFESWGRDDQLRVTRFGRFLRNTHLDELPQLVNVLRGDMSIIGPRPEMVEIERWASSEVEQFSRRLAIKPGITGLAQVTQGYTGRDPAAYARKLEINDHYRERMSFSFDAKILAMTAIWMLRGRGWDWKPEPQDAEPADQLEE